MYSNTIPLTRQPGSITKRGDVIIWVKRNGFSLKMVTALCGGCYRETEEWEMEGGGAATDGRGERDE